MILIGVWMGLVLGLGVGVSLPKQEPKLVCTKDGPHYKCIEQK